MSVFQKYVGREGTLDSNLHKYPKFYNQHSTFNIHFRKKKMDVFLRAIFLGRKESPSSKKVTILSLKYKNLHCKKTKQYRGMRDPSLQVYRHPFKDKDNIQFCIELCYLNDQLILFFFCIQTHFIHIHLLTKS